MLKKLFQERSIYKKILLLALPIMLQQAITNTVSLLDTLMVSSVGDDGLAGVYIVSQIFFVVAIFFFGGSAGSGIYIVQFLGAKDEKRMRQAFLMKALMLFIAASVTTLILSLFGKEIVTLFLKDSPNAISEAMRYLNVMIYSIFPFAIIVLYATTLRENKHTILPMIIGVVAVLVNLTFNYLLIEGHFFFPRLGVEGAAIASLISRIFEALLLVVITHFKGYGFAKKVYQNFYISKGVVISTLRKTFFLLLNELAWSIGMVTLTFFYSQYGKEVLNAFTIASSINNLFFIIFGGLATAISIIIGEELGSGKLKDIRFMALRLILFGVFICLIFGIILAVLSPFTPHLFADIAVESKHIASSLLLITSFFLWVYAVNASCFFILRAGGSTLSAFILDSGYTWLIPIPVTYILVMVNTNLIPIIYLFILVQSLEFIKLIIGTSLVYKGKWIQNLTTE